MVNFQRCVHQATFIKLKKEMLVMVDDADSPADSSKDTTTVDKDELMKDNIAIILATLA